ncbi:putative phosphatidate phosphatase [Musca vetustissima]|uniref:putative phosphatidate phosphatase n=1 Tax=Musca vetustissima TaxID=27455 RepID=UPI002AB7ED4C|nr:putative phosphatidate phosphatase [Musca vetustissima]
MYPLHKDTVSHRQLYGIGVALPVVMIVVIALMENFVLNSRPSKKCIRAWLMVHVSLLPYLFGFAAERLLKEIGKFSVGRLRPFFFAVCQPLLDDETTCDWEMNHGIYIQNYTCRGLQNSNSRLINYGMRTSFPSGHTSLTCYSMIFCVYYLQRFGRSLRHYRTNYGLFVPLLQFGAVLWAWFVAISRVTDYKHHVSDVLAGCLLGLGVGIAVCRYVHGHLKGGRTFLEAVHIPKRAPTLQQDVQVVVPQQQQQTPILGRISGSSSYATASTSLAVDTSNVDEVHVLSHI